MIHAARRRAALLPARRGMRAPWLRRRVPDDPPTSTHGDAPPPGDVAVPGSAEEPSGPPPTAAPTAAPAPVRPTFGHPTF